MTVKTTSSGSDYGQVDSVTIKEKVNAVSQAMIKAEMMVNGKPIAFQLDSEASVNILNEKHVMGKTLKHSNKTLVMWNGAEVKPLGECRVKMINSKTGQKYAVKFVIVKEDFHPLLGANAIQKMALITVNNKKFKMVAKVSQVDEFISQHSDSIINEFEDDVKEAEYIPVIERRLLELRSATKEDRSMQQLQQEIVEGWPEDKIHLDPEVRPYFSMRNEMTVQDGLIFRGNLLFFG